MGFEEWDRFRVQKRREGEGGKNRVIDLRLASPQVKTIIVNDKCQKTPQLTTITICSSNQTAGHFMESYIFFRLAASRAQPEQVGLGEERGAARVRGVPHAPSGRAFLTVWRGDPERPRHALCVRAAEWS